MTEPTGAPAAVPPQAPDVDSILGKPTVDDLLGPEAPTVGAFQPAFPALRGADNWLATTGLGQVLDAVGQGASNGWGTGDIGLSEDSANFLRQSGIFPDVTKGQAGPIRGFNEAILRPAAAVANGVWRGMSALTGGGLAAIDALFGRDPAALAEMMLLTGTTGGGIGIGAGPPAPPAEAVLRQAAGVANALFGRTPVAPDIGIGAGLPAPLAEARDLGILGPGGEAAWKGLRPVPDYETSATGLAYRSLEPTPGVVNMAALEAPPAEPSPAAPPADIHAAARAIAPDTFAEYDAHGARIEALRGQLAAETAQARAQAAAQAPGAAEIADLQERLQDTTPRLAKKYQARLAALMPAYEDALAQPLADTDSMAGLRQAILQSDYVRRDLAPQVTAAYREAAKSFPAEEPAETVPAAPAAAAPSAPETTAAPLAPQPPAAPETVPGAVEPQAPETAPAPPETAAASPRPSLPPVTDIAADVSRQLVAAGRPADEAAAAGQLVAAHYEARATRFAGRLGSPEQLYSAEAPTVTGAARGGPGGNAAGRAAIRDGRTVITLFARADASTFIHETGHHWLEELMGDARNPAAPADLRADAASVRRWLGAEGDAPLTTRQHERFARGFEQYMLEGRAPSTRLSGVFAQFRGWLQSVYQQVNRLGRPITPDIRDVFDRLLGKDAAETTIAPEPATEAATPEAAPAEAAPPRPVLQHLPPDNVSPYVRVPKEPTRLAALLRRGTFTGLGPARRAVRGVRDPGGDVAAIVGGSKGYPGLINSAGMELDRAAELAHEEGYFPNLGPDGKPDVRMLLDALKEDVSGNPRYSHRDAAAVAEREAALAHNAEIDRLSAEHGIPTHGPTAREFFDRVAAKVGPEADARAADEAGLASEDVEQAHEDIHDLPPEAGQPLTQDEAEALLQESLNHVHGPLHDAEEMALREPGDEGPGAAGRHPAAGPAGAGQMGGGARPAGRAGPAGAEVPAGAADRFAGPSSGLIDRAGNIRLDLLGTPEDVNAVIREAADENEDFIGARRGVVSDAQVLQLADAMGMTPAHLNRRRIGEAFNAEQVMAARQLLIRSATAVRDAMIRAASGSDADVLAYGEARARHRMIQEQVAGITAEAGRALRAFRAFAENPGLQEINEFVHNATGRTLYQLRAEAQLGLQLETPAQVSKFVADAMKPNFWDMALEYWINGLISGPATHTTYAIGNALLALAKAGPETGVAAGIGIARRALGDTGPRVLPGEVGAGLYGIVKGQRDGIRAAWQAARSGVTTALPGEAAAGTAVTTHAIPGLIGEAVRLPSRGVGMVHSYFRAIGYEQAIAQSAYRMAAEEGLTGPEFTARVAQLTADPPADMMAAAVREANGQTMMNTSGEFTRKLASFANSRLLGVPVVKFVMPFVRVAGNVMDQALLERSPLGILDADIRANLLGRNGPIARDTQIARVAVGSAIGALGVGLAAEGLLTGGGPSNPREAAIWRMTGRQPYSVRIGDTWYGIHRLGPLAMVLGVGADMHDMGAAVENADAAHIAGLLVTTVTKGLLDETWMRGPADLVQALHDPDRYGAAYAKNQLASWVPASVAMAQLARASDPYTREARTILEAAEAKIPWLSQTLLPRRDIFGAPIPNKDALGLPGLSAIYESRVNNDPTVQAMLRAGVFPAAPERRIRGVDLTEQQYDDFARTAGVITKQRLDALVASPSFASLPPGRQQQVMAETIANAREAASTRIRLQNPDIVLQAYRDKQALLTTGKKGTPQ